MGLLRKTLGFLNRKGGDLAAVDDGLVDRRFKGAQAVLREGVPYDGTITGIERKLENGTDANLLAITVATDGGPARVGVRLTGAPLDRLRLGSVVPVRVDGKGRAAVDWAALAGGEGGQEPAQRSLKEPPADGIEDTALDGSVQKRLRRWPRERATIAAVERRTVMGTPTSSYDVLLERAGGARTTSGSDEIPFYATWLAEPGREVPVAVDPERPERCAVDWPAAAAEAAS